MYYNSKLVATAGKVPLITSCGGLFLWNKIWDVCWFGLLVNLRCHEFFVQLCAGPDVHVVIDIAHRRTYKQWLWLRGRNKKSHHLQPTNYRTLTNTYVNISIHSVQYDRKSSPVLNISSLIWRSSLLSFRHHFRTGWGHFRAITNFFIIATSWLVEKFPRHLKPSMDVS